MSRKNVLEPVKIASSQSLASAFQSQPTIVSQGDNVGYQISVDTTNSTGEFAVQVSMDYQPQGPNGPAVAGEWSDLLLSGTPTVAAANDIINISLNQLPFKAVRLAYTPTVAGTGTCDIFVSYKTVGA
jgi:hypothetical protein